MSRMTRLRDFCCSNDTQKNGKWWLTCLSVIISLGIALTAILLVVLRFTVTPEVKAYVEDARLDSFAFANTTTGAATTSYNISISVALILRNLNGAMSIEYTKPLVATFLFDNRRLYNVTVEDEGHKHRPLKRELHLLRTGGEVYVFDAAAVEEFKKQNATGEFKVEMRLSGELVVGIGNKRKLDLSCPLALHVALPGPDVVVFHEVDCEPDKPKRIIF